MSGLKVFRKTMLYLLGATRGGPMRAKIISLLIQKPLNTNQLSQMLGFDYKTIIHHLDVMLKNNWVTRNEDKYGELFFTAFVDDQKQVFNEIMGKIGKKL